MDKRNRTYTKKFGATLQPETHLAAKVYVAQKEANLNEFIDSIIRLHLSLPVEENLLKKLELLTLWQLLQEVAHESETL